MYETNHIHILCCIKTHETNVSASHITPQSSVHLPSDLIFLYCLWYQPWERVQESLSACLLLRGAELSKRMPFASCATPHCFQFWSFETLCLSLFSFHFYNKYSLHAQSCNESFAFLNVVDIWSVCFYSNTSWIRSSLDNLKITALF